MHAYVCLRLYIRMSLYLLACPCMYVLIILCMCLYVYPCMCLNVHAYAYTYVLVCSYVFVCAYMSLYVLICPCMCLYVHGCARTYIHVSINACFCRLFVCFTERDLGSREDVCHPELLVFLCQHFHLGDFGEDTYVCVFGHFYAYLCGSLVDFCVPLQFC